MSQAGGRKIRPEHCGGVLMTWGFWSQPPVLLHALGYLQCAGFPEEGTDELDAEEPD